MIGELNVRHRKIKKILNKYFTKKEGQKIRCNLRIPYRSNTEYEAVYHRKVTIDGITQAVPVYVTEDEIRKIVLQHYSYLDVVCISDRYDNWGDPKGFTLSIAFGMEEKGPKKELRR